MSVKHQAYTLIKTRVLSACKFIGYESRCGGKFIAKGDKFYHINIVSGIKSVFEEERTASVDCYHRKAEERQDEGGVDGREAEKGSAIDERALGERED